MSIGGPELTSDTITQNLATNRGGGIACDGVRIRNSIVAANKAGASANDIWGAVNNLGFNLIGIANPGLGSLANNGGPTFTLAVPTTSPAYRTGDPSLWGLPAPLGVDQRGMPRNDVDENNDENPVVTVGAYDPGATGNTPNSPPTGANNTVTTRANIAYTFAANNVNNTLTSPMNPPYTFTLADFSFSDPNNTPANNFQGVILTSLPANGYLTLNGSRLQQVGQGIFISAANISAGGLQFYPGAGNGSPFATFTFKVQDDGGTANGGSNTDPFSRTMTINVTAVSNAPAGANNTVTTLENTAYAFAAGDFGFTDPNDSPANSLKAVEITTLPASGTLKDNGTAVSAGQFVSVSDINAGHLVYTPAANATGDPYASFTFQVQDNGGTSNGGVDTDPDPKTMTVNVMSSSWVNQAPSGTNGTVTTLENTGYAFAASDFGFSDSENSPANDFLSVEITTLPAVGTLTDNGVPVTAGQFVNSGDINAGLLIYTPATNSGGSAYDSFTFQVRDDGGTNNGGANTDPVAKTMTANVTMVNQPPVGTDNTVTTLENTGYTFAAADFGFSDPNSSPANSLYAVEITDPPMFGTLTDHGVAVSAGQFVSVNDINAGYLVFTPETDISGTPYDAFFFQVQDNGGTANGGIDTDPSPKMMTVNVTWVNQAPVGVSKTIGTPENTPYTFAASDFGFTDPNGQLSAWLQAVEITTLPNVGTLTDSGTAVSAGQFVSLSDILAGNLVYTPAANGSGVGYASFTFQVQNDGGTANGGVNTDPTPKTMTVNVEPPPTVTGVVINQNISALYNAAGQPAAGVQRSMVDDIVYTFSTPVNITSAATDPSVFTVAVASGWTGTVPTLSWAAVAGSGGTQWAVSFSGNGVTGGSIANGCYNITISDPSAITAVADGQSVSLASSGIGGATQSFFRLYGDINADKFVNGADNIKFNQALTTYNAAFDFNADGYVNSTDTTQFDDDLTLNFSGFTTTI